MCNCNCSLSSRPLPLQPLQYIIPAGSNFRASRFPASGWIAPGEQLFTLSWQGSRDSGASQPDHRIRWNSRAFPLPQKSSKWCLKTSKDLQNEVPRGTWNHQNQQKAKNIKSNENHSIYCVFEGLGHQKSVDFPINDHQNPCLQSKHAFGHLKSHQISESCQKVSQMRCPKYIRNH